MKPRTDALGIELERIDVDRVVEYQKAVDRVGLRSNEPFDSERLKSVGSAILGRNGTRKLYTLVFSAAGVFLEDYQKASDEHDDICRTGEIGSKSTASYLLYLESKMQEALLNRQDAIEFNESIDKNLFESVGLIPEKQLTILR